MKSTTFLRWSGLSAIVAGLLTGLGRLLGETPADVWIFLITLFSTIIAFIGIYLFQRIEAGNLGFLGVMAAVIGNVLFLAGSTDRGSLLYFIGLLLLGIASLRAKKFPLWVAALFLATPLIGIPGAIAPSLAGIFVFTGGLALALAFIGAGYTIWTQSSAGINELQA